MSTENQTPSDTDSNLFVDFSARTLKSNLLSYKKEISLGLVMICIFVVLYAYQGFNKNQRHDGKPAMLMSTVSYVTTTVALITALLFL